MYNDWESQAFLSHPKHRLNELWSSSLPHDQVAALAVERVVRGTVPDGVMFLEGFSLEVRSLLYTHIFSALEKTPWCGHQFSPWVAHRLEAGESFTELLGKICVELAYDDRTRLDLLRLLEHPHIQLMPLFEQAAASHKRTETRINLRNLLLRVGKDTLIIPKVDAELAHTIRELCELWRETRSIEVAEVLDLLSARIPVPPAFERISDREYWATQILQRGDPALLPMALALPWPARWVDGTERLGKMMDLPPDPRIAMAMLHFLQQPPYERPGLRQAGILAMTLLARIADPRLREKAMTLKLPFRDRIVVNDRKINPMQAIGQGPKEKKLTPEQHRQVELARRLVRTSQRNRDSLLGEIYQSPSDISLRRVYADLLIEDNDPRGEFIALQCDAWEGRRTPQGTRRENALLNRNRVAWAAYPPHGYPEDAWFTGGFVSGVVISGSQAPDLSHPSWRMVESLRFSSVPSKAFLTDLLSHPNLARINAIDSSIGFDPEYLPMFQNLTRLCCWFPRLEPYLPELPNLRHLRFHHRPVDWRVLDNPQLTELTLHGSDYVLETMPEKARRFEKITLVFYGTLARPEGMYWELGGDRLRTLTIRYNPSMDGVTLHGILRKTIFDASRFDNIVVAWPASAHQTRAVLNEWLKSLPAEKIRIAE